MGPKSKSDWLKKIQDSCLRSGDCLLWQKATTTAGYASIRVGNITKRVHRFVVELSLNRNLSSDEFVCHSCDTPNCVSINHLFIGTHLDNMKDRDLKGRTVKGDGHYKAKLTLEQVQEIKQLKNNTKMTQKDLSIKFKVTKSTISWILNNRSWQ